LKGKRMTRRAAKEHHPLSNENEQWKFAEFFSKGLL
jgi:hypothetical protein